MVHPRLVRKRGVDAIEPITADDDEIRAALADAELQPLLPALAYLTGDLGLIEVPMKGDFSSSESRDALSRLRNDYIPATFDGVAEVYVTGDAAWDVDYVQVIREYTPLVFTYVLGFSFLLLLITFRSIVVPLKAVAMNLLSVGAAYGLLSQWQSRAGR